MRAFRLHLLFAVAVAALPGLAAAAPEGATLASAVDGAWLRSVPARTLEARQGEVDAAGATARSWVAAAPTLGLAQRSDRWTDQRDRRESEMSLSASVWLPGQRAAREKLAARGSEELAAQLRQARLAVAGEVRNRAWEAAAAEEVLIEKRDHLQHLLELAEEVQRRVKAGDLARSDGLMAQQEALGARIDMTQAATKASEALTRFRVLTGLRELPRLEPEPIVEVAEPFNARLGAARASERRAEAALRLAEATRSAPPTVGLSYRHEQQGALPAPERSIGVALQIPLGSAARNRPVEALAQTQIATAAAEAAQALAGIDADVAHALEQLSNVREALEAAVARAAALREHAALIDKAFRVGERGLAEMLRARILSHEAGMAVRQQRVALGLAHAQLNQVRGILP